MDVYEAVISRRSIRRFKDIAVSYEALEKCVNAARLAPSGMNRQLCEYIIIDNEQLLPKVFDSITRWAGQPKPKGALLEHTPKAYIIILINKALEGEVGNLGRVTTYDVGMSAENMILVALEQGLGSCPMLGFERDELRQVLNIPESYDIALLVALGYSDESPVAEESTGSVERWVDDQGVRHVPKRKLEDILHRNKFQ
jgi:nitroreductase